MSTLGFVLLAHAPLARAAEVARHLADHGCPLAIHLDMTAPREEVAAFHAALSDCSDVVYVPRRRCGWGTWSLVDRSQAGAALLLERFPDLRHVALISGACLPLRPVPELRAYLAARPDTDFIESVTTRDVPWTAGGLDHERFSLFFPVSWKSRRRLFDRLVRMQRWLGVRRRPPEGIEPHMGSQWWCLTRRTLSGILSDPRRRVFEAFFRWTWIPDESYFQTLARRYSQRLESRSLTLSKFDHNGQPHLFYDDHLDLLRHSDCFLARKIWPGAEGLYQAFLAPDAGSARSDLPAPGRIDATFGQALARRRRGRPGLYMQSRFPRPGHEGGRSAAPYTVLIGFHDLFENFGPWLRDIGPARVHGALYAPDRAHFADGQTTFAGGLSDDARLRDYNPVAFLTNLLWATRGERQVIPMGPEDNDEPLWFMARDPSASIWMISGAWAVTLGRQNRDFADLRADAARWQKREVGLIERMTDSEARARVRIWSLAEFLEAPGERLHILADEVGAQDTLGLLEMPRMHPLDGLPAFLQGLRNQGMQPHLAGDITADGLEPGAASRPRPHLVR